MPETDLKLICQSIPVSDSGTASTQANAILKGLTGADVQFNIGGEQPTLYPLSYSLSLNKVTVATNNSSNGAFGTNAVRKVYVGDVEVTLVNNEYEIDASDDGKTMTINLEAQKFQPGVTTLTLEYIAPVPSTITYTVSIDPANFNARLIGAMRTYVVSHGHAIVNNQELAANMYQPIFIIKNHVLTIATNFMVYSIRYNDTFSRYSNLDNLATICGPWISVPADSWDWTEYWTNHLGAGWYATSDLNLPSSFNTAYAGNIKITGTLEVIDELNHHDVIANYNNGNILPAANYNQQIMATISSQGGSPWKDTGSGTWPWTPGSTNDLIVHVNATVSLVS